MRHLGQKHTLGHDQGKYAIAKLMQHVAPRHSKYAVANHVQHVTQSQDQNKTVTGNITLMHTAIKL